MTAARYAARPGVVFVPISDAAGSVIALAFPDDGASPAAQAFVDVTREVLAEHGDLVGQLERTAP
jgi:hypothetical protein